MRWDEKQYRSKMKRETPLQSLECHKALQYLQGAPSFWHAGVLGCWGAGVLYCFGPAVYSLPPASKLRASFRMCQKQRAKRLGCKVAAATDFFVWLPWQRDLFGLRLPGACLVLLRALMLVLRVLLVPRLHLHLHLPPRSHLPQQRITDLPLHLHPTSTSHPPPPPPLPLPLFPLLPLLPPESSQSVLNSGVAPVTVPAIWLDSMRGSYTGEPHSEPAPRTAQASGSRETPGRMWVKGEGQSGPAGRGERQTARETKGRWQRPLLHAASCAAEQISRTADPQPTTRFRPNWCGRFAVCFSSRWIAAA